MQLWDKWVLTLDYALNHSHEALIVDPIPIVHDVRVAQINARQRGMVHHQATKRLLKPSPIYIVVPQFETNHTIVAFYAVDQIIKTLTKIVQAQIDSRIELRICQDSGKDLRRKFRKPLVSKHQLLLGHFMDNWDEPLELQVKIFAQLEILLPNLEQVDPFIAHVRLEIQCYVALISATVFTVGHMRDSAVQVRDEGWLIYFFAQALIRFHTRQTCIVDSLHVWELIQGDVVALDSRIWFQFKFGLASLLRIISVADRLVCVIEWGEGWTFFIIFGGLCILVTRVELLKTR